MKKRLILALTCILLLVFAVSCDQETRQSLYDAMNKAGDNLLAPEVTQNVDEVKDIVKDLVGTDKIDGLEDKMGEDFGEIVDNKLSDDQIEKIKEVQLPAMGDDEKTAIVDAINKASSSPKQQEELKKEMEKPIEDLIVVQVVKNTADSAKTQVNDALSQMLPDIPQETLDQILSQPKEDIKEELKTQLAKQMGGENADDPVVNMVADVVGDILGSINDLSSAEEVSQADLVTAQLTVTLVEDLLSVVSIINNPPKDDTGEVIQEEGQFIPGINNSDLLNLVGDVETVSNIGNATGANFNPLGNLNVFDLLGKLVPGIGN